jgi:hypothetical protein
MAISLSGKVLDHNVVCSVHSRVSNTSVLRVSKTYIQKNLFFYIFTIFGRLFGAAVSTGAI